MSVLVQEGGHAGLFWFALLLSEYESIKARTETATLVFAFEHFSNLAVVFESMGGRIVTALLNLVSESYFFAIFDFVFEEF